MQAFLTILTGTLVFALGKIIESSCILPYISYQKVIGEITYQLVFYAQAYSSTNMNIEKYKEASEKFRTAAARLQTYYNPIEWMNLLWFIPSRDEVDEATASLIGLSNDIPPSNGYHDNPIRVKSIRKNLKIRFYSE